jgi:hypothetical protein
MNEFFFVLVSWGGVRLSLLGTSATLWPIVPASNDMMNVDQSVEWELEGETEVLGENLSQTTLSTTNPTRPNLGSNHGLCGGKPTTNRLIYGTDF